MGRSKSPTLVLLAALAALDCSGGEARLPLKDIFKAPPAEAYIETIKPHLPFLAHLNTLGTNAYRGIAIKTCSGPKFSTTQGTMDCEGSVSTTYVEPDAKGTLQCFGLWEDGSCPNGDNGCQVIRPAIVKVLEPVDPATTLIGWQRCN